MRVDARIGLGSPIFADDFTFLQSVATTGTPKLTIRSPSMVHYRGGRAAIDPGVYTEMDEFWDDLSAAYAAEIAALGPLGCTYLQLDDTSLAYLNDPHQCEELRARGGDADSQHIRYIRQINAAVAARPETMQVTTHMCRGNFRSPWVAEVGYDFVAEAFFSELDVDGFFLEYDDARSGGFEPLRFVPAGKQVVLGLVTTKRGELKDADALKRRIDEAAKYVPIDQLCLSPQCGFSSTVEGNNLTHAEQVAKLRLIVEVAADVWGCPGSADAAGSPKIRGAVEVKHGATGPPGLARRQPDHGGGDLGRFGHPPKRALSSDGVSFRAGQGRLRHVGANVPRGDGGDGDAVGGQGDGK
jgi:5-methyltetrahydropteroyltriglutamate--homocysteine methyltransferase